MKSLVLFLVVVSVLCMQAEADDFRWENAGRENRDIVSVLFFPDKDGLIFMGTARGVFKTEDAGYAWRNVLSLRGQNKRVNFISYDARDRVLYAVGGSGLWRSYDQGKSWSRVFKGESAKESNCVALAIFPFGIYLGTKQGLFVSKDGCYSWHREAGKIGSSSILAIAGNNKAPYSVYVACVDGVFRSDNGGQSWERIFVGYPTEDEADDGEEADDRDEEERSSDIRYVAADKRDGAVVYLATAKGVYKSNNRGEEWELLSDAGLLSKDVTFLSLSDKGNIFGLTRTGVFEFKNNRWHELSLGLVAQEVRFLAQDKSGDLYAACDTGLFKANPDNFILGGAPEALEIYCKGEPKIREVQNAAIKYAEVEPEKIKRWRKQAAKKAFLPKVTAGIDRDTGDLWHWETGSSTKTGDDLLIRGKDAVGWDITLSWDFSELIWSSDQTSIDVRSRLMVQLRDDILDEVTKLYFERIRVKMELDSLSITDRKKRLEKELRIRELSASIDALTGGYFSRQVDRAKAGPG